jgi:hypothetical protein
MGIFDPSHEHKALVVTVEVMALILGAESEGSNGDGWRITGIILNRHNKLRDLPLLQYFGRFEALYDARTRTGSMKQAQA